MIFPRNPTTIPQGRRIDGAAYLYWVGLFIWLILDQFPNPFPTDLAALYYGASFVSDGQYDLLYWPVDQAAPAPWAEAAMRDGFQTEPHAFTGPPIRAALAAPLANALSPQHFFGFFGVLYLVLFCTTLRLTHNIMARRTWLTLWTVPMLFTVPVTVLGTSMLGTGAPITIVFGLIVAGFYFLSANAPRRAGVFWAIATSFSVFPVLLAAVFIPRRFRGGLRAFLLTIGGITLISLLLVPLEQHTEYFSVLWRSITTTTLADTNLNLESFLTRIQFLITGQPLVGVTVIPDQSWVAGVNLLAIVTLVLWMTAKARIESVAYLRLRLMPVAVLSIFLLSPVGWASDFTIALCFLPGLFILTSPRVAVAACLLFIIANLSATQALLGPTLYPMLGTCSIVGLIMLFAFAGEHQPRQPARPH